ncbi:lef-10 [Cnaphalocrocis medinalis granulovirus]|uniref:Lef-10 n=2 Tax=Cnaphalocrocis medinalis granulovirus TaxID=1750712 RepID=A0A125QVW8_9BBAC|nr:lef-10 [Cnaphalocrocis medinalis granulovirus]ALN42062.1 lef-10 [Cnaphalocrocis medinalis granulovirus]UNZ38134.1 lef-10 [Cnaphalocrocis medinalis granulovirus]WPN08749.1 lef-10 [Cnaphalocrocis medinalis granulovirus]
MSSLIVTDILDLIVNSNTQLINNKYLIFYVIDNNNDLRQCCYGTIECCIPTDLCQQETVSISSQSDELCSTSSGQSV